MNGTYSIRTCWNGLSKTEPDLDLLESLFELRNIVESAAAALAAVRRTTQDLDDMRDALERMAHHTLASEAGRQGDQDFHARIVACDA